MTKTTDRPECYGCECKVPLVNGYHEEETDIPGTVYVYPCTAKQVTPIAARKGA